MKKKELGDVHVIAEQKGGVGKSTYTHFISYDFAERGYKTVIIDIDPQASLTKAFFGFRYGSFTGNDESNIAKLHKQEIKPIVIETVKYIDNPEKNKIGELHYIEEKLEIDFVPSNQELLKFTESDELKRIDKINAIVDFITSLRKQYDKIIIDTPPSFGIITTAVMRVADTIITPIPSKSVDTDGMVGFFRLLDEACDEFKDINIKKILIAPNMYNKSSKDCKVSLKDIKLAPTLLQVTKNLRRIPCKVLEPLTQKICIQEAPSYKMFLVPYIMDYSRSTNKDIILQTKVIVKEIENYS